MSVKSKSKNNNFSLHGCNDGTCIICHSGNHNRSDLDTTTPITKGKQEVSKETMGILTTIENDIKNSSNSDYVKFNDGDRKIFYFDPDKSKIIFKKYDGQKFEESEMQINKDYKKYYRFAVYDPNVDKDKTWDCSNYKCATDVINFLKQGFYFLKIKRIGSEKNTIYDVEEAGTE